MPSVLRKQTSALKTPSCETFKASCANQVYLWVCSRRRCARTHYVSNVVLMVDAVFQVDSYLAVAGALQIISILAAAA